MTGSARNRVLVPLDFGRRRLNGVATINRIRMLLEFVYIAKTAETQHLRVSLHARYENFTSISSCL